MNYGARNGTISEPILCDFEQNLYINNDFDLTRGLYIINDFDLTLFRSSNYGARNGTIPELVLCDFEQNLHISNDFDPVRQQSGKEQCDAGAGG